jgi:indolepyruvate decarboxylase
MAYVVADYIIERLAQNGVEALFGVPAVYCAPIYNAAQAAHFRTVVTSSDLEAGYAADGYARVRGLSVVAVSYGPGTLSIVNAIAGAYIERSPIVVVNGGPSQSNIDDQNTTGVLFSHSIGAPHTDLDIFRNVTTFCERANSASDVPQLVDNAIAAALIRKRPVYIEIPQVLLDKPCSQPGRAIDVAVPAGAAEAAASSILRELPLAMNPVVIVGEEVQRYRLADKVLAVLDRLQLRWATTLVAKSVLPESHPRFVGVFNGDKAPVPLKNLIRSSGLIFALGAVFGSGHAQLMICKVNATIRAWDGVVVYRGGPPQAVGLPALVDALHRLSAGASPVGYTPVGVAPVADAPAPAGPELGYQQVFDVIAEPAFLDASFTVIADTFLGIYPAAQMRMPTQDSFITDGLWASIGHSVGAAVGAFVPGGKRPLVLIGDGGFQMVGQAVSTMVRQQHNSIVVIIDNRLYGIEQYLLGPGFYTNPPQEPLQYNELKKDWNFEAFARALGVTQVATVNTDAALRTALANAKAHTAGPSVIRALVDRRSLPAGLIGSAGVATASPDGGTDSGSSGSEIPIPPGVTASYIVFDRDTGAATLSHNEHDRIRSASLVKLMIALDYLDRHGVPISGQDKVRLESMLRSSDDEAASELWIQEGWETIVERAVAKLGLHDTSPPVDRVWWGYTPTSAADIVAIYRYILDRAHPMVRDFIMSNLHQATRCASEGVDQSFGIPSVISHPAYKQGWSLFGDPQNPGTQVKRPRADLGAAKDGPLDLVQDLVTDVDLTRPAMHTTGTFANDRKIAAVLSLQPYNTDWDTSVTHVTQLVRDIYMHTESTASL